MMYVGSYVGPSVAVYVNTSPAPAVGQVATQQISKRSAAILAGRGKGSTKKGKVYLSWARSVQTGHEHLSKCAYHLLADHYVPDFSINLHKFQALSDNMKGIKH